MRASVREHTRSSPTAGVVAPRHGALVGVWRAFEHHLLGYRRTWRGTVVSSFANPVLYLLAMGLGLGAFVDAGGGPRILDGQSYLHYIAPGLLAAVAMLTAAFESTYPVMSAWKWQKTYYGMLSTPLRVGQVLAGHVLFVGARVTMTATIYLAVVAAFGAIASPWGVLSVFAAVLVGMALAGPTFALAIRTERDIAFAMYFRFTILPMFLFSGAFFPVTQLPDVVQPIAYVLPLWHGVELSRSFAMGSIEVAMLLVHVGYLCSWIVGGFWLASRAYRRRLVV